MLTLLEKKELEDLQKLLQHWEKNKQNYSLGYMKVEPSVLFGVASALEKYQTALKDLVAAIEPIQGMEWDPARKDEDTYAQWLKARLWAESYVRILPVPTGAPGPLLIDSHKR